MGETEAPRSDHPPTWKFDYPIYHPESRTQWRSWLDEHHDSERGVWLCSWRDSDRPRCAYTDAVEEAICFGWIDSTITRLDEARQLQMFTPRKPKSTWTRLNRARAADMESQGLMRDAGRKAIQVAKQNGWWTILDPVEDLIEPDVLRTALDDRPDARANWDQFPPSARKQMLWWVISAARDETKLRRTAEVVDKAAIGIRALG